MCFSYSVNFKAEALQSRLNLTEAVQVPEPGFFVSAFTYLLCRLLLPTHIYMRKICSGD